MLFNFKSEFKSRTDPGLSKPSFEQLGPEVKEIPDCEFQMYVPLVRTAPNLDPVLEKLKVAPSIFGATFLSVSSTLTSLRQKEEGLLKALKPFTTNNIRNNYKLNHWIMRLIELWLAYLSCYMSHYAMRTTYVTVRVCQKLKTSWKSVVFTNNVGKNSRYFVGVFIKQLFHSC